MLHLNDSTHSMGQHPSEDLDGPNPEILLVSPDICITSMSGVIVDAWAPSLMVKWFSY